MKERKKSGRWKRRIRRETIPTLVFLLGTVDTRASAHLYISQALVHTYRKQNKYQEEKE